LFELVKEFQMTQTRNKILFFTTVLIFVLSACSFGLPQQVVVQPTIQNTTQAPVVATATATEMPSVVPPTNTPLPTQTATIAPTMALPTSTIVPPTPTNTAVAATQESTFACDIIDSSPSDDKEFHSGDSFDIKWTIVNTGTEKWKDNTILKYQSGPKMTSVTKIVLPDLKPGGQYDVLLDATATGKSGRQVMVWAVIGPDKSGAAAYWMCYPYTRIVIK
jgi:hypothetical protein